MHFNIPFNNYAGKVKALVHRPVKYPENNKPITLDVNFDILKHGLKESKEGFSKLFGINLRDNVKDNVKESSEDDSSYLLNLSYDTYMRALTTRAMAVMNFCNEDERYSPWIHNWKFLQTNLKRTRLDFKRLDASDQDIAYVIDKGSKVCFKICDKERFAPINIYQYVLYHEMAHMSTEELQHTKTFHKLLNLLTLAAYELGFIDLTRLSKNIFTMNGQAILSATSLQDEILLGCNHMIEYYTYRNDAYVDYYTRLRKHVARVV